MGVPLVRVRVCQCLSALLQKEGIIKESLGYGRVPPWLSWGPH